MAYSPYNELKSVYDAKVAWGNATTDEERQRQSDLATKARQALEANGYGYLANQVSAEGANADAVKKILDEWSPKVDTTTGDFKTGVDNPAYNKVINSASNKNDIKFDTITSDHANMNSKYNDIYGYANSDVTQTDEYKSSFKNIMPSYTLSAMQGRENEVASGGASNGGNVDSFAAANAMRQQTAITAKGQALAHQMGLEAANARVQNVRGILADLGGYNSSVYSAMDNSINNDRGIASDIFNNEQTALNNDVARKSEIAAVTGYAPDEWVVSNNPYMNEDGTIKDKYKDVDFSIVMKNAKATGDTAAYNAAAVARFYKIMGNYGLYGQYDDGNYALPGSQRTANYDLTTKQIESAEKIASGQNATELALADKNADLNLQLAEKGVSLGTGGTVNTTGTNKEQSKANADKKLSEWLYSPLNADETGYFKSDWNEDTNDVYAARDKINDPETLKSLQQTMIKAGWTLKEWNDKLKEWKTNIAKQAAKIEGLEAQDPYAWIDVMNRWKWVDAQEYAELNKKYRNM